MTSPPARLPLVDIPPSDPLVRAVFERFEREGREPIALYRALAKTPKLLAAYSGLAQGLRHESDTPPRIRELVIMRIAQLTDSPYEWSHHYEPALAAGVTPEELNELAGWRTSSRLDEPARAALRCAEEMHDLSLSDEALGALRREFGDQVATEIVILSAFYQCVARMLQALGLRVEPNYRRFLEGGGWAGGDSTAAPACGR